MIYVIATLTAKPGMAEKLIEMAQPCIEATRQEVGCMDYDLCHNVIEDNMLVFVERWIDRDSLEAHFNQPHLIAWRDASAPLVDDVKVEIIHPDAIEEL